MTAADAQSDTRPVAEDGRREGKCRSADKQVVAQGDGLAACVLRQYQPSAKAAYAHRRSTAARLIASEVIE